MIYTKELTPHFHNIRFQNIRYHGKEFIAYSFSDIPYTLGIVEENGYYECHYDHEKDMFYDLMNNNISRKRLDEYYEPKKFFSNEGVLSFSDDIITWTFKYNGTHGTMNDFQFEFQYNPMFVKGIRINHNDFIGREWMIPILENEVELWYIAPYRVQKP